jgi:hypothetical protein
MVPILQTGVAWLLVVLFLPKIRRMNRATVNTGLFVVLFSTSITLQIASIYELVSIISGVNHLGWLISYLSGVIALYTVYKALVITQNPVNPQLNQWVYYDLVFVCVVLLLLFPIISNQPVGANEADPDNLAVLLFRLVPYLYAIAISVTLGKTLYQYQSEANSFPMRLRWLLLSGSVFLGASYFILRTPYFVVVFLHPDIANTIYAQTLHRILGILTVVRVSWLFFFVPRRAYEIACKPLLFIDKLIAFRHLVALQALVAKHFPQVIKLDAQPTWAQYLHSLDYLRYRAAISILDSKRRLKEMAQTTGFPEDEQGSQTQLLEALEGIQDDDDFESIVARYSQIGKHYYHHKVTGDADRNQTRIVSRLIYSVFWGQSSTKDEKWAEQASLQLARKIVEELGFDFSEFTMERFVHHIEKVMGRKIFLYALPLPQAIDGAWISDAENPHEYIFFNSQLPPILQAHVQLHELGHFLCGHSTFNVTSEMLRAIKPTAKPYPIVELLMRANQSKHKQDTLSEAQAEAIAMVTQARAIHVARIQELSHTGSNNSEVDRFLHDMGLS